MFGMDPRFGKNARIIHFIGPLKPWHHTYLPESNTVIAIPNSAYQHSPEHLRRWWRAYQATLVRVCVCMLACVCVLCMCGCFVLMAYWILPLIIVLPDLVWGKISSQN